MTIYISLLQIILYPFFWIVNFFLKSKITYNLKPEDFKRGVILVANHQSRLDFVLIYTGIPFHRLVKMLPLYQLTAEKYMNTWWKKIYMTAVGCIPVETMSKEKAIIGLLDITEKIMDNNTILIFPEGKVVSHKQPQPKIFSGVGYLFHKYQKKLLPISLRGFSDVTFISFFFRRHNAMITYGKPMKLNQDFPDKIARSIMKSIYSL